MELPFGHIKRNLNAWAFLLRGLERVKAEMTVLLWPQQARLASPRRR
ncbi:MAG: hypothetical protein HQK99_06815 [Nitrospirae bacterium]|nr:hypothetical protein [Nitrospirota bacterium]